MTEVEAIDAEEVDEPVIEVEPEDYQFVENDDQRLRCFILKSYADQASEIDGGILVDNMEKIFEWIKDGKVPRKRRLTVVNKDTPAD